MFWKLRRGVHLLFKFPQIFLLNRNHDFGFQVLVLANANT